MSIAAEILAHVDELALVSEHQEELTRSYLTAEHRRANELVAGWMRAAGMRAREDAVGNIVGRWDGGSPGSERAPALLLGSHLDTVRDAGKYDGMLGVVTAIACVDALHRAGRRLSRPVEVIGFADEEGVRFQSTYLGSRALCGRFDPALLERRDADGISMAEALSSFGLDPQRVREAARPAEDFLAYVELHIEQGPVLESLGVPVGVVSAISGATRLRAELTGVAGHAGTVPMGGRRDALAGAAECVLATERLVREAGEAVATIGRLEVAPGATNVIPGSVRFSLDLRAAEDTRRRALVEAIPAQWAQSAARRSLRLRVEQVHEAASVDCSPEVTRHIREAIRARAWPVHELASGAGHDAAAMASLVPVGMVFVRCRGGISHHPAEYVAPEDVEAGACVLHDVIESYCA